MPDSSNSVAASRSRTAAARVAGRHAGDVAPVWGQLAEWKSQPDGGIEVMPVGMTGEHTPLNGYAFRNTGHPAAGFRQYEA